MMALTDTIAYMQSDSHQSRFLAEYYQLDCRLDALTNMLDKHKKGTLPFEPKCPIALLEAQQKAMEVYKEALIERARIEGIIL